MKSLPPPIVLALLVVFATGCGERRSSQNDLSEPRPLRSDLPLLVAAAEHLTAGEPVYWMGVDRAASKAASNDALLMALDLKAASDLAIVFFGVKYQEPQDNYDLDAQANFARLLRRAADAQANGGSEGDQLILKPLLMLAGKWETTISDLKSRGADPTETPFRSGIVLVDEQTEEGRALVAEENATKARLPLNQRLRGLNPNFSSVSGFAKTSVTRLRETGKADFVDSVANNLGITSERLKEILGE